MVLKAKLWVFLKQTQPRIIVKQHVPTTWMEVKRNRENQKWKKQSEDKMIKAIETKRVRYIKKLFEQEEDFDKPVRLGNFYNNSCIEYESNGDRNKTLSVKEYLEEIKSCFKDIINNLK